MEIRIDLKKKEMDLVKDILKESEIMEQHEIDVLDHDVTFSYGPMVIRSNRTIFCIEIREDLSIIILDGITSIARHIKGSIISLIGLFRFISNRAKALFENEKHVEIIDGIPADEYFKKLNGDYKEVNDEECNNKI